MCYRIAALADGCSLVFVVILTIESQSIFFFLEFHLGITIIIKPYPRISMQSFNGLFALYKSIAKPRNSQNNSTRQSVVAELNAQKP